MFYGRIETAISVTHNTSLMFLKKKNTEKIRKFSPRAIMGSFLVLMTPLAGSSLHPASKLPPPWFFFCCLFLQNWRSNVEIVGSNPVKHLISCLDQMAYITASIRAPDSIISSFSCWTTCMRISDYSPKFRKHCLKQDWWFHICLNRTKMHKFKNKINENK